MMNCQHGIVALLLKKAAAYVCILMNHAWESRPMRGMADGVRPLRVGRFPHIFIQVDGGSSDLRTS